MSVRHVRPTRSTPFSYYYVNLVIMICNQRKLISHKAKWIVLSFGSRKANQNLQIHCVKSVRILSYSGPYFPTFGLNTERSEYLSIQSISAYSVQMRKNEDQNNSKYEHFSRSDWDRIWTWSQKLKTVIFIPASSTQSNIPLNALSLEFLDLHSKC